MESLVGRQELPSGFHTEGAEDRPDTGPQSESERERERCLSSLDQCLEGLDPGERALVLGYYGEGRKADLRSRLARDLGISATALRIRAHRLRARLERCVQSHLAAGGRA